MEKNGGKPKKLERERVLGGTKAVELSEDEASKLVGGIVERGISGNFPTPPSSAPRPSVLPFPVARHRSHAPHWTPRVSQFTSTSGGGYDDEDEDDDEDNDPTNYNPIADFANPIQRKKKKELDFSKWRDLVPSNNSISNIDDNDKNCSVKPGARKQKMNGQFVRITDKGSLGNEPSVAIAMDNDLPSNLYGDFSKPVTVDTVSETTRSVSMEVDRLNEFSSSRSNDFEQSRSERDQFGNVGGNSAGLISSDEGNSFAREAQNDILSYREVDMAMKEFPSLDILGARGNNASATFGSSSIGNNEEGPTSIESQIDAENRALLQRMSPEDIAEAQAEIRNRINPELLKILKKRGQQKSEKQRNSTCTSSAGDVLASGDTKAGKHITKGELQSSVPESNLCPPDITPAPKDTEKRPDDGVVQNSTSKGGSLWDAWSKRVEAVRNLRFSLEGNAIEGSALGQTYNADNVAERDFLRTEGDPGAAGYTIKEALALTRSIVPGQRALALHLLASVLSKALHNIYNSQHDTTRTTDDSVDWEAIWAYAIGPEPEFVLSLRMALDDNHNSVVLASAKVIQCMLACEVNENFFNTIEKMASKDLYTAPIFRSRPDIKHGFLGGGFWKYSTKPSNILPPDEGILNDKNEEPTIQDDNIVAGQDIAAGLVRMAILPRLCYILETDPAVSLEESTLSILIALARHSPTCANSIWKCERLLQTIIDRYSTKDTKDFQVSKIKTVTLLRVLAQSSQTICTEFIKKGFFQVVTWQLYRATSSVDEWVKSGRENCKLASELMIEQLRFWKVCIMHGHCVSYFSSFFPALCLWLNPPTLDKLIELNVFHEFASISKEVYLVLETLARKLPDPYSPGNTSHQLRGSISGNVETWCWSDVGPMVDSALNWIELMSDSPSSKLLCDSTHVCSLLWILSAIAHMLDAVLVKAASGNASELKGGSQIGAMLPDLVAKIAFQIIKAGFLNFSNRSMSEHSTEQCGMHFSIEKLCCLRHDPDTEVSLASVWCLHGIFRVIVSIDCFIQMIRDKDGLKCFRGNESYSRILEEGILKGSIGQWRTVICEFMKLVTSEWHLVNSIEVFGRGGPAPGVGVGWGASSGGFWSLIVALVQADAKLLTELLETFHRSPAMDLPGVMEETFITQSINSAVALSLMVGPGNKVTLQSVFDVLLQIPILKYLDQCIFQFLHRYHGQELLKWEYREGDLMRFSKILNSHFRNRWLSLKKKKKKAKDDKDSGNKTVKKGGSLLGTIHEDVETSAMTNEDSNSLTAEWAHQRLPLPSHWLLSPITTISDSTPSDVPNSSTGVPSVQEPTDFIELAKAGLFLLLGIEAMSSKLPKEDKSSLQSIPLIWKLHSLSVPLLVGMGVLEEERSRDVFEALQSLYGRQLDELQFNTTKAVTTMVKTGQGSDTLGVGCLRFQSEIHENYSTFIETLVEQFSAISYGDLVYGRQIAIYLHRQVDASVRLATWNSLSNARVLELLPPLNDCLSQAKGYLEPIEDNDSILEAFVKSWISGSLDRAATRASMTYAIAVHHLSSFIFNNDLGERLLLRNKLVKSLLRDYSRKHQHEAMMCDFIRYNYCFKLQKTEQNIKSPLQMDYIDQRFALLKEACEGNTQLLAVVEKLQSSVAKRPI